MKRRDILSLALGVFGIGTVQSSPLEASFLPPEDGRPDDKSEIMVLFEQRVACSQRINALIGLYGEEWADDQFQQLLQLSQRIMALPSTSATDFAAKLIVDTEHGGCLSEWETGAIWLEARRLTRCPV